MWFKLLFSGFRRPKKKNKIKERESGIMCDNYLLVADFGKDFIVRQVRAVQAIHVDPTLVLKPGREHGPDVGVDANAVQPHEPAHRIRIGNVTNSTTREIVLRVLVVGKNTPGDT